MDMVMHFNIAEVNGGPIDEANQISFILQPLSKNSVSFQTNTTLTKLHLQELLNKHVTE